MLLLVARQEKLLQGLMTEIVRMTTQQQPLEVGIPLYPFSHASVFAKGEGEEQHDGEHIAPLPVLNDVELGSPGQPVVISPMVQNLSPPMASRAQTIAPGMPTPQLSQDQMAEAAAWVMTDLSRGAYK
jgi:hypothetical protein